MRTDEHGLKAVGLPVSRCGWARQMALNFSDQQTHRHSKSPLIKKLKL
jgi:hypothetical protein